MSLLALDRLSKDWFGVPAVRAVSLSVAPGEVLGLIGQNGAGKSTLMNMVGGVVAPSSGAMTLEGRPFEPRGARDAARAGLGFIHQELNLFTNLSVAENLFVGGFPRRWGLIDRAAIAAGAAEALARVDLALDPATIVGTLSPGERQLVEIARALHDRARLIIFDEPTTSLTPRETERLFETVGRLRASGTAVIYISHILGDVLRLADRVAVMRDGALVDEGPAAAMGVPRMIRSMIGRDLAALHPPRTAAPAEEPALELRGLSQPGVVEDVHLTVRRGEILGLFGLMGSGRSELARIAFGLDPAARGEVRVAGRPVAGPPRARIRAGLAFVTENRREEGLMLEAPVADNLALAALPGLGGPLGLVDAPALLARAEDMRAGLSIKAGDLASQPVRSLSGGNQQKVVIGKWLLAAPRALILDEPTRGVDVGAKFEIYALVDRLAAAGNGVLLISSELEELMGLCDRIAVMSRGEVVGAVDRPGFSEEAILRLAFREAAA